jgi:hypothetical protein
MEKILEDKKIGTCPRPPAHFVVHDITRQLDDPLCPVSVSMREEILKSPLSYHYEAEYSLEISTIVKRRVRK